MTIRRDRLGFSALKAVLPSGNSNRERKAVLLTLRLLFAYNLTVIEGRGHVIVSLSIEAPKTEQSPTPNPWILPARFLTVLYGCPEIQRLSHYFLPKILLHQNRVLYLDGANQISPLLIARFARGRGLDPSAFNKLIRIARAFTCVSAGLKRVHFRRFGVGHLPERRVREHTYALAAAEEQAVLNSSFFPATWIFNS
jgi:hypothetical protein